MSEEKHAGGEALKKINAALLALVGITIHIVAFFSFHKVVATPALSTVLPLFILLPPLMALSVIVIAIIQLNKGYRKLSAIIGLVLAILWFFTTTALLSLLYFVLRMI